MINHNSLRKWGIVGLAIVQVWLLFVINKYPYIGVHVKEQDHKWIVSRFATSEQFDRRKLRIGDHIIRINGHVPEAHMPVKKWHKLEQARSVIVARGGEILTVRLDKYDRHPLYDFMPIITEMVLFTIGWLLLRRKDRSTASQMLACLFFMMGLIYLCYGASLRGDVLSYWLMFTGLMLIPVMFLHYVYLYIKDKASLVLSTKYIKGLYTFIFASSIVKLVYMVSDRTYIAYKFDNVFTYFFFVLIAIVNVLCMFRLYFKYRHERTYFTSALTLISFCVGIAFMPIVSLSFVPNIFTGLPLVSPLISGWFGIMFMMGLAWLTTFYGLHDISVIMKRVLTIGLIAVVPSAIIMGWDALVFGDQESMIVQVFTFLFILFIVTTFMFTIEYSCGKLEEVLFPRKTKLDQSLKRIASRLGYIQHREDWNEEVLRVIVDTLTCNAAAIVRKDRHGAIDIIMEGEMEADLLKRQLLKGNFQHPYVFWFDINLEVENRYYIVIERRSSKAELNREEQQWMDHVLTYLSISLNHIYRARVLQSELTELQYHQSLKNDTMEQSLVALLFDMQEKNRGLVAQSIQQKVMKPLHDMAIQLEETKALVDFEQVQAGMEHIQRNLEDVSLYMQHLNSGLRPALIQTVGLQHALRSWIEGEFAEEKPVVQMEIGSADLLEAQPHDWKRHVFRMAQELLHNGKRHAYASLLQLSIKQEDDNWELLYVDDGVGFATKIAMEPNDSAHGLMQLRNRVQLLDGSMEALCMDGSGSKIRIVLPMVNRANISSYTRED
ncbi:sensor histidine kinase [Paenibacillus taiwanensis]|uniref:sensor histidine kinase n=1 Tax=Paenibacillus taiwanensis TaxID=401638 RepID=UPI0004207103|nr:ATP-binding protein [Paenibacillus taiwanensis]